MKKKLCCCRSDQKCLLHFHSDIHIFLVLVAVVLHGRDQKKFPPIEIFVYWPHWIRPETDVTLFIWLRSVLSNWVMWFLIIILSSNFIINFQFLKHLRICGAVYSSRPTYCYSEFCWYILVRAVSINENLFTWGTVFFTYVRIISAHTVWVETWAECTLWKEVNCLHRLSKLLIFHKCSNLVLFVHTVPDTLLYCMSHLLLRCNCLCINNFLLKVAW